MNASLAAVFEGKPHELELRSFPLPQPAPGETLVRILGCTLCGSDLHTFTGRRSVATPTILGHEIVGQIEAFGDGPPHRDLAGQELRVGDRVTWSIVAHCGDCFYCRRGLPQKCVAGTKYGHEALRPGRELLGGLAEHCLLVRGTSIVKLPAELPLAVACPANCATATIAAAVAAAGSLTERSVAVIGAGLLGLTACAMARVGGAAEVICVDTHAGRVQRSVAFGATRAISPPELAAVVSEATSGYGVDVVLELSGANAAVEATLPALRLGGTLVLVGAVFPTPPIALVPEQIVRRNLTIRGVHNYAPQHLVSAVQFLADQHARFPFAELVSDWHLLAEARAAFAQALDPQQIRVGVQAR
jgi:alcohol dehydrogenase